MTTHSAIKYSVDDSAVAHLFTGCINYPPYFLMTRLEEYVTMMLLHLPAHKYRILKNA